MKFCRAWPESCKQSQEQVPETQVPEPEVFTKDYVEAEVRQSLQAQINRVIRDVVEVPGAAEGAEAEDPKPPKTEQVKEPKRRTKKSIKPQQSETRDLWIVLVGACIVFLILFSSMYHRISVLEKVIFESRV